MLLESTGATVQAWCSHPVKRVCAWGAPARHRLPLPDNWCKLLPATFFLSSNLRNVLATETAWPCHPELLSPS